MRSFDAVIGDGTNDYKRHLFIVDAPVPEADKIGVVIRILAGAAAQNLADLTLLVFVLLVQALGIFLLWRQPVGQKPWVRRLIFIGGSISCGILGLGFLLLFNHVIRIFPLWLGTWLRGGSLMWGMISVLWTGALLVSLGLKKAINPKNLAGRRKFLNLVSASLFAAPVAVVGYGVFVQRFNIRLREQKISIPGLPPDFEGLRIVQLTDIHLSPFLSVKELARAVAMANETVAHLALVTGDMISGFRDPLDTCLKELSKLGAEAGIYGCMGNHEIYAGAENYAAYAGARLGIKYLRSQAVRLKFGGTTMNLAGVDYQRFRAPYLVGAESMVQPAMFNVLLSHNPDVFPVAARQGYDLTISGHTHGGQVRVEILREDLNIARFFTPFVDGLYQRDGRSIFVSRGIGTIGLPARLGAPPEVALLHLCRS